MSIDVIITIAVILFMFGALASDRLPPEAVLMAALGGLLVTDVLTPAEAFGGFANPAVVALGGLYVLTGALRQTGALEAPSRRLLDGCQNASTARLRLTLVTAPLSAFLNNTPIVAALMPVGSAWAKRKSLSPRGLLLPLSYAAVLGGTCTLLGTATHLVVHGLLLESGQPGMGVFELLPIGLPVLFAGLPLSWFLARIFLDGAEPRADSSRDRGRQYTADLVVTEHGPLVGKTIEDAGLRNLAGLFLVRIERASRVIAAVGPSEVLEGGDRLSFAGVLETMVQLQSMNGLEAPQTVGDSIDWSLHECVVSRGSPLIGRSIKEANFRGLYGAAVVAVHRQGGRISSKLGDIVLRHGDTLLMQAAPGFAKTFRDSTDFYLISELADAERPRHGRAGLSLCILGLVVTAAGGGIFPLSTAAVVGAVAVMATGCISAGAARRSVDTSVLVVMGAAIGVAAAVQKSGLSQYIVDGIIRLGEGLGPVGVLVLVYVTGMVLTEILTNVAAAALLFPVALGVALSLGVDPRPYIMATSISAAISLATPLGYQTNMMVYGPGGYRFSDFLKMGLPLQLFCGGIAITMLTWVYGVPY